jgi:hypothetical protein
LVEESGKQWDKILNEAQFLLNNTYNRSINDIPSRLLFGVIQKSDRKNDLVQFVEKLNDSEYESLPDTICHKRCHRQTKYSENDLVCIRSHKIPGENSKLKCSYRGPYIIKRILDNNRYEVSDLDNFQNTSRRFEGIFDPNNLRLYEKFDLKTEFDIMVMSDGDEYEYEEVEYLDDSDS